MQPCREEGERYCCKRYCFWSDSPQRHDDMDLFLPDDLEAGGCCRCKPICYTNYKLNPHYNKVQYYCRSYCYPCFKIAVRVVLVLAPFIIYIILFVGYQVATLPIIEMIQNATFLAYTLILLYLGLLSFVFVITLQRSKHNKYQIFWTAMFGENTSLPIVNLDLIVHCCLGTTAVCPHSNNTVMYVTVSDMRL